ncbi:EAL domain-containing response regulator [Thalassotalea sp. 1_MG-2023]|uniref:EAL domain-containing response regulator n=1 Tax=Thalassotalea sp. 1_MG-2023 TaxID=3062680 RepID=UPI0026E47E26|nr:EAL domain-containing response regulator [Thalassotalea sp. 1_MG-2023]MDO6427390.1 EAL domain-containing response regulator [Thalassotalea sp. 1_MG-2023]
MNKTKVLVVDDSKVQRNHVIELCRQQGVINIESAENGQVALDMLTANQFDLVFIDLEMPVMDGVELVSQIAERKLVGAVIILSSKDPSLILSIGTMAESDGLSVVGTFQKPMKEEDLTISLNRMTNDFVKVSKKIVNEELTKEDLLQAMDNREITLYYQPKLTVKGLLLKGVEALSRWHHPERGMISPVQFIDAAERFGVISQLTEYLFDIALHEKKQWQERGLNFHLSFNLSPLSLADTQLAEQIFKQVERFNIAPKDIVLEITENALSGEVSKAIQTLATLRLKGFNLAIDDYGTGFANAQQLSRVPSTELKLDRILVDNVSTNPHQQAILKSTVALSKDLQLTTVAEGVEYLDDYKFIYQLDVDLVQGYYFAKPMAPSDLIDWIKYELGEHRKAIQRELSS